MIIAGWARREERGSVVLVRLMIWLSLNLGWRMANALLFPITAYFWLFSRGTRPASRAFLTRALDRKPTRSDVFRHIFVFASVLLDRVFLLSNQGQHIKIEVNGLPDLTAVLARHRGCVLLGSHLGSFEVLRAFARQSPVPVKVLMYRGNDGPYSRSVATLDPALASNIIEIGTPEAMLRVSECLERGEMIGILADRTPRGEKLTGVPFFGDPAPFPTGPLILAAVLRVPVVLFFGIHTGAGRYAVIFEHFADRILLDGTRRDREVAVWVRRYAERLEVWCRRYPFNWFNFYDFWEHPGHEAALPTQVQCRASSALPDSAHVADGAELGVAPPTD